MPFPGGTSRTTDRTHTTATHCSRYHETARGYPAAGYSVRSTNYQTGVTHRESAPSESHRKLPHTAARGLIYTKPPNTPALRPCRIKSGLCVERSITSPPSFVNQDGSDGLLAKWLQSIPLQDPANSNQKDSEKY